MKPAWQFIYSGFTALIINTVYLYAENICLWFYTVVNKGYEAQGYSVYLIGKPKLHKMKQERPHR